jgi:hypothetical protein
MKLWSASLLTCAILLTHIHTVEALSLRFPLIKLDDHLVQQFIVCYPAVQLDMKRPESKESGSPRRVILDRCGLPKNVDWGELEFAVALTVTPEDMSTAPIYVKEEDQPPKYDRARVREVYAANQIVLKRHRAKLKPILSDIKRKIA